MEHKQCHHLLGALSDYLDGALEASLCSELEHHLQGCENCRVVVDTLKKTISLYQTTAAQSTVPVEVRQRLYQRLDLQEFLNRETGAPGEKQPYRGY